MAARFPSHERRYLCAWPGIGDGVVDRIEQAGIASLQQLHQRGVDNVLESICRAQGQAAWRNRRRALQRALNHLGSPPER
jgi:hypothetical protein